MPQDLRLALRTLYRRPGFSAAAIATLALGIGASSAIFSVAYGVTLRPLPYPQPDRIVRIYEANLANGKLEEDVSEGAFHDWREGAPSLESAALLGKVTTRVMPGAAGDRLTTLSVSPAFFQVLGVAPVAGRVFHAERQYTPWTAREVVLSFAAWQRLFGGNASAIGQSFRIDERDDDAFRIVGVMPERFAFGEPVDAWLPDVIRLPVGAIVRNWRYDRMIGRLRPGASIDQARSELETISARLAREFPASNAGWTVTVELLHASIVGPFGRATWMLLAAVGLVLLIACLNVGGLLVARAIARERETAVRFALGADSWRLLRLWLAESSVLAAVGLGLGLLLAWSGVAALRAAAPPGIPRLDAVALDLPTLAVSILSAVLAVTVFTVAPLAGRPAHGLSSGLRAGSSGSGDDRTRQATRMALTVAQCAGAATLAILAVMLTRSFIKLSSVDLGWDGARVLSLDVTPPITSEVRRPWFLFVEWSDRLVARLEASPSIERAAITTQIPLAPGPFPSTIGRGRGKAGGDPARWPGVEHHVTDSYFQVMGMRLIAGRAFGAGDRFAEPQVNWTPRAERGTAIVSESTARALWPGRSALGQALWLPGIDNVSWREVVGIVGDVQFHAVGEQPPLHVFVPWTQMPTGRPKLVVKARTAAAVPGLVQVVREIAEQVAPGTRLDQQSPLSALVARATAQPRFTSRTVAGFGVLALTLAAVGIYGTLSYLVTVRRREIGIRLALGASRASIGSNVLVRGLLPALAGGVLGLALALGLARTFRALLFRIEPVDVVSLCAGALLLMVVAAAAAVAPARRAAAIEPAEALRAE